MQPSHNPYSAAVAGPGVVEAAAENIAIGSPISGVVVEVFAKVGMKLKPGTPLFRLDDRQLQADLGYRKAAVEAAKAESDPAGKPTSARRSADDAGRCWKKRTPIWSTSKISSTAARICTTESPSTKAEDDHPSAGRSNGQGQIRPCQGRVRNEKEGGLGVRQAGGQSLPSSRPKPRSGKSKPKSSGWSSARKPMAKCCK